MNKPSLVEMWDICRKAMYPSNAYEQGLVNLLQRSGMDWTTPIIDVACGSGHDVIALKKRGFHVVGADQDVAMTTLMSGGAKLAGVVVEVRNIAWEHLGLAFGRGSFEMALCSSNSFIYCSSWGVNHMPAANTLNAMRKALENFSALLTNTGILYIDLPHEGEQQATVTIGRSAVETDTVEVAWTIEHYPERQMRKVTVHIRSERGEIFSYPLYSYLLSHYDLKKMLREAGFSRVERIEVGGQSHYAGYIAHKLPHAEVL